MNKESNNNNAGEDLIELKDIYSFLIRNKKLISKFVFTGIVLSLIYAFTAKRTWKGEFQIVIDSKQSMNQLNNISDKTAAIAKLSGIRTGSSNLKTQVEILGSPSLLIDVFNFVKEEKAKVDRKFEDLKYRKWKKQLLIENIRNTSVVNLSYKDKNKEIILPTLEKISSSYKEYSGKDRKRANQLTYNFLNKQRDKFLNESRQSFNELGKFGLKYNLQPIVISSEGDDNITTSINYELEKTKATNEIAFLKERLKKIYDYKNDNDEIIFIAKQIPDLRATAEKALRIKTEILRKRNFFKDNDEYLKDLNREKNMIYESLIFQITNYLEAQIVLLETKLNALDLPEEILEKYRNLLYKANTDKRIFNNLDRQFQIASLEKDRYLDPWELITNPTLITTPVAPSKRLILLTGTILGFLFGIGASIYKEKTNTIDNKEV